MLRAGALLVVLLSVVAAGCGGSSQSAEEKWANDVCGQVTTWKDSVTTAVNDIQSQVQSPSSASIDSIKSDITTISDATKKLSSGLKSTGAPNTDAGTQAKQQVDAFTTQLDTTVQTAKDKTSSIESGASITSIVSTLASLGPSLQALGTSAQTALKSVQTSSSALKDGFQKADNCKPYR